VTASFSLRGITAVNPLTNQPIYTSFETVDSANSNLNCSSAGKTTIALESLAIILEFGALFVLIFAFYKKQSIDSVIYKRILIALIGISMIFMIAGVASFPNSDCLTVQTRVPAGFTLTKTSGVGEVLTSIAIVLQGLLAVGILFGKSIVPKIFADSDEITTAKV
jgi:hypothetical protein